MNRPPVNFESHLPERRRRAGTTLYGPGCCCTCCCCLHTVGGLIGAAIASASGRFDPVPPFPYLESDPERAPTLPPVTGVKTVESAIQSSRPAPIRLEEDEDNLSVSQPGRAGISAAALFWQVLLGLSIVVLILGVVMGGRDACAGGLLILALTLPAVQLASALVVAIVLLFSRRIDRDYQFRLLGKITGGTMLGTVTGVLLMILIGFLMSVIG
jgi:hypothetical protein